MNKTMDNVYGDGSTHEYCEECGMCIPCGDCICLNEGEEKQRKRRYDKE